MRQVHMKSQQGVALLVTLVMLLVLVALGTASLKGIALDTRVVANRQVTQDLINTADAAIREGEFRYYGLGYVADKLEPKPENCTADNKLKTYNKPCLLSLKDKQESTLRKFVEKPLLLDKADLSSEAKELWMPYKGLDKDQQTFTKQGFNGEWHSLRISSGEEVNETINPEYGAFVTGKGTFHYLINGKAELKKDDKVENSIAIQSTIAVILDGINN